MAGTVTEFGVNHPLAVKRWSNSLAREAVTKQYFNRFMGTGEDALIKVQRELAKDAGDKITVGLVRKLRGNGVEGDAVLKDSAAEEGLVFFDANVMIDQRRKSTKSAGKMSEQRVPYNIRAAGRSALSDWWAEDYDQQIMMYLAGMRGVNAEFHVPTDFTGRAGNTLTAPDITHHFLGGDATGKADLAAEDKVKRLLIEKASAILKKDNYARPFRVKGEKKFVFLMHPWNAFDLRNGMSEGDWLKVHMSVDSKTSPIYDGSLGELAGMVLHEHPFVIEAQDGGAGGDVFYTRNLLLGAHSGMIAWGGFDQSRRFSWFEEFDDRGNQLVIATASIYGTQRSIYDGKSLSTYAFDCAATKLT